MQVGDRVQIADSLEIIESVRGKVGTVTEVGDELSAFERLFIQAGTDGRVDLPEGTRYIGVLVDDAPAYENRPDGSWMLSSFELEVITEAVTA